MKKIILIITPLLMISMYPVLSLGKIKIKVITFDGKVSFSSLLLKEMSFLQASLAPKLNSNCKHNEINLTDTSFDLLSKCPKKTLRELREIIIKVNANNALDIPENKIVQLYHLADALGCKDSILSTIAHQAAVKGVYNQDMCMHVTSYKNWTSNTEEAKFPHIYSLDGIKKYRQARELSETGIVFDSHVAINQLDIQQLINIFPQLRKVVCDSMPNLNTIIFPKKLPDRFEFTCRNCHSLRKINNFKAGHKGAIYIRNCTITQNVLQKLQQSIKPDFAQRNIPRLATLTNVLIKGFTRGIQGFVAVDAAINILSLTTQKKYDPEQCLTSLGAGFAMAIFSIFGEKDIFKNTKFTPSSLSVNKTYSFHEN